MATVNKVTNNKTKTTNSDYPLQSYTKTANTNSTPQVSGVASQNKTLYDNYIKNVKAGYDNAKNQQAIAKQNAEKYLVNSLKGSGLEGSGLGLSAYSGIQNQYAKNMATLGAAQANDQALVAAELKEQEINQNISNYEQQVSNSTDTDKLETIRQDILNNADFTDEQKNALISLVDKQQETIRTNQVNNSINNYGVQIENATSLEALNSILNNVNNNALLSDEQKQSIISSINKQQQAIETQQKQEQDAYNQKVASEYEVLFQLSSNTIDDYNTYKKEIENDSRLDSVYKKSLLDSLNTYINNYYTNKYGVDMSQDSIDKLTWNNLTEEIKDTYGSSKMKEVLSYINNQGIQFKDGTTINLNYGAGDDMLMTYVNGKWYAGGSKNNNYVDVTDMYKQMKKTDSKYEFELKFSNVLKRTATTPVSNKPVNNNSNKGSSNTNLGLGVYL